MFEIIFFFIFLALLVLGSIWVVLRAMRAHDGVCSEEYLSHSSAILYPIINCKYCKSIGFCSRKTAVAYKESKLNVYLPYGAKCDEIRGTNFCKFKEGPKDEVESKKLMFTEAEAKDHISQTIDVVGGHGYRKLCKSVPVNDDIPHIPFCKD